MKGLGSFWREEAGAVASTYAIALTGLIAIGGVAFDYTRMVGLDSELQNAADQAALAAVTQLDGETDACLRSAQTAVGHLRNLTMLSNDGGGNTLTINSGTSPTSISNCADQGWITFYSSYTDPGTNTLATSDADATVVRVVVDTRQAQYAFTPIVGAIFNNLAARAVAGIGSAICDVPPLMICNPTPGTFFDGDLYRGRGIQVTGKGGGAWAPGDFGFLEVGASGQLANLAKALAYDEIPLDCAPVSGTDPETGNAQILFDAINTRFDIYDFSTNAAALSDCETGACPGATGVAKDLVHDGVTGGNNDCKFHNSGYSLTANPFNPAATGTSVNVAGATLQKYHSGALGAMGLPRDLCHYTSYGTVCGGNNKLGNAAWARGDYFAKYHSAAPALPDVDRWTRYQTYLWEEGLLNWEDLNPNYDPDTEPTKIVKPGDGKYGTPVPGGGNRPASAIGAKGQQSTPVCTTGKYGGTPDPLRRVLTVAVVENCSSLTGGAVPVQINEWVDMFFVEPVFDARGNGSVADSIYMEVIQNADLGEGGGAAAQDVRKDKPFLIE